MSTTDTIHPHDTERRYRQLRDAVDQLLDEIEQDPQSSVDVASIRDTMPDSPGDDRPIATPWERDGYETKAEWQQANRE